jgi:hypothetical protein
VVIQHMPHFAMTRAVLVYAFAAVHFLAVPACARLGGFELFSPSDKQPRLPHSVPAAYNGPSSYAQGVAFFAEDEGPADFVYRCSGGAAYFDCRGITLEKSWPQTSERCVMRIAFLTGACSSPVGDELLSTRLYKFKGPGSDCKELRTYARVVYPHVWPGIDVRYSVSRGVLKSEYVVAPGGRVGDIRLRIESAEAVWVDSTGSLCSEVGPVTFREKAPLVYQETSAGRVFVKSGFALHGNGVVGFRVWDYDSSLPLIIDPDSDLEWSTYLGGGGNDQANAVVVDGEGYVYIAGETFSLDYPVTTGAYRSQPSSMSDVFVTKLSPDGSSLVYTAIIGGAKRDTGRGIAFKSDGSVVICGETESADFPTTPGAVDTSLSGDSDGFVCSLSANGSALLSSTYLGGGARDSCQALALDTAGNTFVVGASESVDFPCVQGCYDTTPNGEWDAFCSKLDAGCTQLLRSTVIGSNGSDYAFCVVVAPDGSPYVGGSAYYGFPTTSGAARRSHSGFADGFVTHFSADLSQNIFSTYLGGNYADVVYGLCLDSTGVYVTGGTYSTNFPVTRSAFGPTAANGDAFVSKLGLDGSNIIWSVLMGGNSVDYATSIAVLPSQEVCVAGLCSSGFPTTSDAYDATHNGGYDAFLSVLTPDIQDLVYSTYLGGAGHDYAKSLCLDSNQSAYVAGVAGAATPGYPAKPGAYQSLHAGGLRDAFVSKLGYGIALTLASSPPGSAILTPPAGCYRCARGTVFNICCTPVRPYVFDHWEGDVENPLSPCTRVTVNDSKVVTAVQVLSTVARVKKRQNGSSVYTSPSVVTGAFDGFFYVQQPGRISGIRVDMPEHGLRVGDRVEVAGVIKTNSDGERFIDPTDVDLLGSYEVVEPLCIGPERLGGGDWHYNAETGAGQRGITGGYGLNNIGLLVRTYGNYAYINPNTFYLSGPTGPAIKCIVPPGTQIPVGTGFVCVTGVCCLELEANIFKPVVLVRSQSDILFIGAVQNLSTISQAKRREESARVFTVPVCVTAAFDYFLYVEQQDRSSGIRVNISDHGCSVGDRIEVVGFVKTNSDGERFVETTGIYRAGYGEVEPLYISLERLGGGDWYYNPATSAGQQGITGGCGLNNIGLLIRTSGNYTYVSANTFYLSGVFGPTIKCIVPDGVELGIGWSYACVTGVCSIEREGDQVKPVILVRDQDDIVHFP